MGPWRAFRYVGKDAILPSAPRWRAQRTDQDSLRASSILFRFKGLQERWLDSRADAVKGLSGLPD